MICRLPPNRYRPKLGLIALLCAQEGAEVEAPQELRSQLAPWTQEEPLAALLARLGIGATDADPTSDLVRAQRELASRVVRGAAGEAIATACDLISQDAPTVQGRGCSGLGMNLRVLFALAGGGEAVTDPDIDGISALRGRRDFWKRASWRLKPC